jgi:hypothetical protein
LEVLSAVVCIPDHVECIEDCEDDPELDDQGRRKCEVLCDVVYERCVEEIHDTE